MIMAKKQPYTKSILLIAIDLCKVNYQTLLITYLKLTKKTAKHVWKGKKSNQNAILLGLKIID